MSNPSIFGEKAHSFLVLATERVVVMALCLIARILPKPTRNNTNKFNTHLLIDWRDEFLSHEECFTRRKAIEGILNYAIFKYDSSNFYSDRADVLIDKLKKSDWVLVSGKTPDRFWKKAQGVKSNKELRQNALVEALNNREFDKVLNLID